MSKFVPVILGFFYCQWQETGISKGWIISSEEKRKNRLSKSSPGSLQLSTLTEEVYSDQLRFTPPMFLDD